MYLNCCNELNARSLFVVTNLSLILTGWRYILSRHTRYYSVSIIVSILYPLLWVFTVVGIVVVCIHYCGYSVFTIVIDSPVDTGRKLNVHKTFRRHPGCLLNFLCTFTLPPVSTGSPYPKIQLQVCYLPAVVASVEYYCQCHLQMFLK